MHGAEDEQKAGVPGPEIEQFFLYFFCQSISLIQLGTNRAIIQSPSGKKARFHNLLSISSLWRSPKLSKQFFALQITKNRTFFTSTNFHSPVLRLNRLGVCSIRMENGGDCKRGALIVLEGLDRSGKSSQSSKLVSNLEGQGHSVELWRFPDRTTSVGATISSYLSNNSELDDRTIHLLFSANRWEKRSLMESRLREGTSLVVDRYSYSGVVFSAAKGLDVEWCKAPEVGLLAPDVVVYLDILPEKAAERGGYGGERYEKLEFQKKVAQYYQELRDPSWKIIDASQSIEDIEKQLQKIALDHVMDCKKGRPLSYLWLR